MVDLLAVIADRLQRVKWRGSDQFTACCPAHDDRTPSLSVKALADRILVHCHTGCTVGAICAAIDLTPTELFFKPNGHQRSAPKGAGTPERRIVATYDYTDEAGNLLFQTVRYTPKDFRQRRPDGNDGWIWNLEGARLVLFNLPDVLHPDNKTILICEGEKDCLAAHEATSLCATTNPMGAGKWRKEYNEYFRGKNAIIFPDADAPGIQHAETVAQNLHGIAASVKICKLPAGIKDFSEWDAPGDEMALYIATKAIEWTPQALQTERQTEAKQKEAPEAPHRESHPSPIGAVLRRVSDIQERPLCWLWPGRIPLGKLTLFAGDPGVGKSAATIDIAARVTRGGAKNDPDTIAAWPDGAPNTQPGSVVLLSAEDDPEDTIKPRLRVAGANLDKVHILQAVRRLNSDGNTTLDHFCLASDIAALQDAVVSLEDVRLVVIDPISAYLGDADSHVNAKVRGALAPLVQIAQILRFSVIALEHLSKSPNRPALYRPNGSIAFTAAARAVWFFAKNPDNFGPHLMLPGKMNLAREQKGLSYTLVEPEPDIVKLVWGEAVDMTADAVLNTENSGEGAEAKDWLRESLSNGPVAVKQLQRKSKEAGLSWISVRRAKDALSVTANKEGYQGPWQWELKGAHPPASEMSTFEQPAENKEVEADAPVKGAHSPQQSTFGEMSTFEDGFRRDDEGRFVCISCGAPYVSLAGWRAHKSRRRCRNAVPQGVQA